MHNMSEGIGKNMKKIRILVVSDPSRKEESDVSNTFSAFKKYTDEIKPIIHTISGVNGVAWSLHNLIAEEIGQSLGMIIYKQDYKANESIINNSDVLILLPSLDRSGFCEDIEKKWLKIKGDVNIEVM